MANSTWIVSCYLPQMSIIQQALSICTLQVCLDVHSNSSVRDIIMFLMWWCCNFESLTTISCYHVRKDCGRKCRRFNLVAL